MTENNTNNICSNEAYKNAINQKQRMAILNIPPQRYDNLANNPYLRNFNQYQLDMRRKVEILKYSSNRISTQTNSLTKAQKYAQLVNGAYQQRTYSRTFIDKILIDLSNGIPLPTCPTVTTISTACDIPGPPIVLFEDETVPIYNLISDVNAAAFGIINQETPQDRWNYTQPTNTLLTDNTFVTITTIYILNTNYNSDTFSISIPLSTQISGSTLNNISYSYESDLSFSITNATINVLYSYSDVTLQGNPSILLNNIPLPSSPIDLSINVINDTSFNISTNLGILKIDNLYLYTQTGYIYDIQLKLSYQIILPTNYYSSFNKPTVEIYANTPTGLMITSASIT